MDDQSDGFGRYGSRIEVFAGSGRKRWDDETKARIVSESLEPGAIVTHIARRHGCRPQQVHDWRRLARQGELRLPAVSGDVGQMFVPLLAETVPPPSRPAKATAEIAIEFSGAIVRVLGRPGVEALSEVLLALKKVHAC